MTPSGICRIFHDVASTAVPRPSIVLVLHEGNFVFSDTEGLLYDFMMSRHLVHLAFGVYIIPALLATHYEVAGRNGSHLRQRLIQTQGPQWLDQDVTKRHRIL